MPRALLVLLALLVSACRPSTATTTEGKVRIRFSGYTGNPAETKVMADLVDEFNARSKDIEVVYEPIPGQYYPKLLTMLVSHTAPDVFYLDVLYFKPFLAKKKILRPLNDYLASSAGTHTEDFIPQLVDAFRDGDTIYGIPKDFNTLALFYNKDAFDAAHEPYPDSTWDLDKMREVSKHLTKLQGDHPQYGFGIKTDDTMDRFIPLAEMFGASLYGRDGKCAIASPQGVRALEYYSGMKLVDHTAIYPGEVGAKYLEEAFGRRAIAMVFNGSWMIPFLQESGSDVRVGVAELPKGAEGRHNMIFTVSYSIPQTSEHPKEAWKFIEYVTSARMQSRITWALPSRRASATEYAEEHPEYRPVLAGAAYAEPFEFGPKGNRVQARLDVAFQEVFLAGRPPAKALEAAAEEIDRLNSL
jgi:multiple sugar transport system substrate-binding protein